MRMDIHFVMFKDKAQKLKKRHLPDMKLSAVQELLARTFGYRSFHELHRLNRPTTRPPALSLHDDHLDRKPLLPWALTHREVGRFAKATDMAPDEAASILTSFFGPVGNEIEPWGERPQPDEADHWNPIPFADDDIDIDDPAGPARVPIVTWRRRKRLVRTPDAVEERRSDATAEGDTLHMPTRSSRSST